MNPVESMDPAKAAATSAQEDTLEPVSGPRCLGLSDTADPRRSWRSLIGAPFARAAEQLQVAWQEPEGLH